MDFTGVRLSLFDGEIRFSNPLEGKHLKIAPTVAYAVVSSFLHDSGNELMTQLFRQPDPEGIQVSSDSFTFNADSKAHWLHRGWDVSLNYYAAFRGISYIDKADRDNTHRDILTEQLVLNETPPARREIEGSRLSLGIAESLVQHFLGDVLMARRSVRRYKPHSVTRMQLNQLLWYGLDSIRNIRLSTEPSKPLDLLLKSYGVAFDFYIAIYDIEGIDRGVYCYDIIAHELIYVGEIADGEQEQWFWGMPGPRTAAGTVFLVGEFAQWYYRYPHEHALRDLYIEAGRIVQRLIITSGYVGLGTLVTPAVVDSLINARLKLEPSDEAVIYTMTFGIGARTVTTSSND